MLFHFSSRQVALEMRLQFFEESQKRALIGVFIAGEVSEQAFVLFRPVIGVGRKLPFDVFQVLLRSLEEPMRAYRFLHQRTGYLGLRPVMPKPGIAKRFKLGWIFMAQDQFCGAAAMRDGISTGTRFSVGSGRTSAAVARRFRWSLRGTRWKVDGIAHSVGAIRVWRTGELRERSEEGQAIDLKRDRLFYDAVIGAG